MLLLRLLSGVFLSALNSVTFYWFDLNVLWVWARACWAFISAYLFFLILNAFHARCSYFVLFSFTSFSLRSFLCQTENFEFDQNQNAIKYIFPETFGENCISIFPFLYWFSIFVLFFFSTCWRERERVCVLMCSVGNYKQLLNYRSSVGLSAHAIQL